jgi:ribosomal protein L16 Arg81 hydroxylase
MQKSDSVNESSPHDVIQTLRQSVEKTLDQNRVLLTEIAHFTRGESLRVAQRNLDHATHAFAHFDGRRDLAGLIEAQQEWIKQMMQDYATQSLHYAEMFQNLMQGMRRQAEHAASEFAAEAEESAQEFGKKSETMMHQPQRAAE